MRSARFVASGFGIGYAPFASGTIASATAVVIGVGLLLISPFVLAAAALLATFGGYFAIRRAAVIGDPGWVVVDEFAGQWITLLGLITPTPSTVLAAFVLFRVLDITKPGPIGWADRQHGAFGVMADDVIAGLLGASMLIIARSMRYEWMM